MPMSTSAMGENRKMSKIVDENPFYKMSSTLNLFQQGNKLSDTTTQQQVYQYLDSAWKECGESKVKKELFFCLLFSLGDISNREHNLFKFKGIKKPDQGGQSKRKVFMYCLKWMVERTPIQFYTFLPIIGEYYNLGGIMFYQLKTDRWKGTLQEVLKLNADMDEVVHYISKVLKASVTTDNQRTLWAKWLPHVPTSSRIRKYVITEKNIKTFKKGDHDVNIGDTIKITKAKKDHTKAKDAWVIDFIRLLSEAMDWKITNAAGNVHFEGYRQFRKKYLSETEAVKFSAPLEDERSIVWFDKTQFYAWLDKQPSGARYRIACRIVSKDKSGKLAPRDKWKLRTGENLGKLYIDWLASKKVHQTKLASLTPEETKAMNPTELKQLKQAAKVNVGGDTLIDLVAEIASGKLNGDEFDTKAFSMLEKMTIGLPVLVVSDKSGSMGSASLEHKGMRFSANNICQLATTIFLLKNSDPDAGEFFVRFGTSADVIVSGVQATKQGVNKFMNQKAITVGSLVDRTKAFSWNLANVSKYIPSSDGGTDLSLVAKELKRWVDETPEFKAQKIDQINKYSVILVISDGDLNSHGSGGRSFLEFQNNMRQWFGWEGIAVMWDVKMASSGDGSKFENIPNVMYFGGMNPAILDQVFRNINDIDVIDQYSPLKSLHNSNRYTPVKELVL